MFAHYNYGAPLRQLLGWASLSEPRSTSYSGIAPMAAGGQASGQPIGGPYGGWPPVNLSSPIGSQPGSWGSSSLPFQAGPGGYGAIAPMGAGGQAAGQWAGNQLGGWLGIPGLGSLGGSLGGLLPFQAGPGGYGAVAPMGAIGGAAVSPFAATAGATTVDPETQAVNDLTKIATSSAIQKLYDYLSANGAKSSRLEEIIPVVKLAADAYGQGNYGQAFIAAYQAILSVDVLRTQVADLPAL